nr:protein ACCELERATED CELL DEATH 6-like isoform X1 [Ziziphus jujuba var. spinosa]
MVVCIIMETVIRRKMDSSSLHKVKEDGKVVQPKENQNAEDKTEQQTEIITNMGQGLYWAAARGDFSMFQDKDQLQNLLTPNKNTILHIYITTAEYLKPTTFVESVLTKCPALLMQPNKKNETPLHIAARYGHDSILKMLIQHAKGLHPQNQERGLEEARRMMRMLNENHDTAFHEAVRFHHLSVVQILIEEDPNLVYLANREQETPLYMAAERGYSDIVFKILDKCKSPNTGGPDGRNALHAATIRKDQEMIKKILAKMGDLLKETDRVGWNPLHHAAYMGYLPAVKLFLELPIGSAEAAYMKDTEGNTALHLAAAWDHEEVTSEIIQKCPECCELVNKAGSSILHAAVQSDGTTQRAMDAILKRNALKNLLNEKDNKGNTPLHHIAISLNIDLVDLIDHSGVDRMAFNNQNQNALDLASATKTQAARKNQFIQRLQKNGLKSGTRLQHHPSNDDKEEEIEEDASTLSELDKAKDANLIVAALIATVTFTAGFTVPGGFISDKGPLQGTPILGDSSAFKTFIIMDTLAMVLSSSAVSVHLFLRFREDKSRLLWYFILAFALTAMGMAAMVLAFVTGIYAILGYSRALSIVACVVGLSFFILFYKLLTNFFSS